MNGPLNLYHCSIEGCEATVVDHKWAKIRNEWFYMKDDTVYCPDHVPDWVEAWRAKRRLSDTK